MFSKEVVRQVFEVRKKNVGLYAVGCGRIQRRLLDGWG